MSSGFAAMMAISAKDLRSPSPEPEQVHQESAQVGAASSLPRPDVKLQCSFFIEVQAPIHGPRPARERHDAPEVIDVDLISSDEESAAARERSPSCAIVDEAIVRQPSPPKVRQGLGWAIISEDEASEEEEEVDINAPRQTRSARRRESSSVNDASSAIGPASNISSVDTDDDDDTYVGDDEEDEDLEYVGSRKRRRPVTPPRRESSSPRTSTPSSRKKSKTRTRGPLPPRDENAAVIANIKNPFHHPAKELTDPVKILQDSENQAKAIALRHIGALEWADVPGIGRTRVHRKYLDQFFYWMAERQRIELRKLAGVPKSEWTTDRLFQEPFRHSNCFRQQDRTSKFMMNEVSRDYRPRGFGEPGFQPDPDDERFDANGNWVDSMRENFFRVIVVWQFGKEMPYKELYKALGDICLRTYNEERWCAILKPMYEKGLKKKQKKGVEGQQENRAEGQEDGERLFGNSFFMYVSQEYGDPNEPPEVQRALHYRRALRACVWMCTRDGPDWVEPPTSPTREPGVPGFFATRPRLDECFNFLQAYWGIGDYHSLQLTLHLTYTPWFNLDLVSNKWITGGRGAKNGVSLILVDVNQSEPVMQAAMTWLVNQQEDQWARLGYRAHIPGVQEQLSIIDVENSLCLWQKYARMDRNRADGKLKWTVDAA